MSKLMIRNNYLLTIDKSTCCIKARDIKHAKAKAKRIVNKLPYTPMYVGIERGEE